jgi:hypothetical protein
VLEVMVIILEWLREVLATVVEAWTWEGEQLAGVVVRHLIACYRSMDLEFSLTLVHHPRPRPGRVSNWLVWWLDT